VQGAVNLRANILGGDRPKRRWPALERFDKLCLLDRAKRNDASRSLTPTQPNGEAHLVPPPQLRAPVLDNVPHAGGPCAEIRLTYVDLDDEEAASVRENTTSDLARVAPSTSVATDGTTSVFRVA